jgi:AbrB family looped-hinge helix DNA binding protein
MATVTIGDRGRITLPANALQEAGLKPGDTLFVRVDKGLRTIELAPAENVWDALAEEARRQYASGQTRSLTEYARERGIELTGAGPDDRE